MFRIIKIVFIFLLLIISKSVSFSQDWDYSYTHYGKEDGLPSNTVYCMTADKDGILWIGTDAGLVKFDGSHFKVFTTEDGLPSNDVFGLLCDNKNRIWTFCMSNNVAFIKGDKIYNTSNNKLISKINTGHLIVSQHFDSNNRLLIFSHQFKINIVDSNDNLKVIDLKKYSSINKVFYVENKCFILTDKEMLIMENDSIRLIYKESAQFELISGIVNIDSLVYYYSIPQKKIARLNNKLLENTSIRSITHVNKLFKNINNDLFLINQNGIELINKNNPNENKKSFLNGFTITNYYYDGFKNNWITTDGNGIYKINSLVNNIVKDIDPKKNIIKSIHKFNHNLILGNNNGEILIRKKEGRDFKILKLNPNSFISFRILKITNIGNNTIIVSTDFGIYRVNLYNLSIENFCPNTSFKNHYFKDGKIYGLVTYGLVKINLTDTIKKRYYINKRFYSQHDFNNELYFGAEDGLYTLSNNELKPFSLNEPFTSRVMDIISDDSLLILATINNGIYFIKNHSIVKKINTENGLSSNNCFKFQKNENELFIATNNGINIYNFKTGKIKRLYESDGLASNTVNDIFLESDTLYAATDNGLSIISTKDIDTNHNFILFNKPTIIKNDTIWNKDSVQFTIMSDEDITFNLNSLSYKAKGDIKYFYRIVNLDDNYIETKDQIFKINFSEPGKYKFEAFAKDANNYVSNKVFITIIVKPYFWQTLLFKIAFLLIILILVYKFFTFRLNVVKEKEEKKRKLESHIHNLELSAWRSKINPHFLFNSLNALQHLFSQNDEELANEYMENFSGVLRKTIDNSGKLLNKVQNEIEYISQYLTLEKIKRNFTFNFHVNVEDKTILNYFIPSMLMQPVLENSLKHGIKNKIGGEINIQLEIKDNKLRCVIFDNGEGFQNYNTIQNEHKSVGIELIDDKIKIIENVIHKNIIFTFETRYDKNNNSIGSITTFIFPIITEDVT